MAAGALISRTHPDWATFFSPFSQLFLRLIKMIIAPLIFGTLVAGVAGAGHVKVVGRMGLRAMIYFEAVTTVALVIGLLAVNLLRPGVGLVLPASAGAQEVAAHAQTWDQILLHTVPNSIVQAMAEGDVLQIVVWSLIFAIALTMVGPKGRPVIELCESLAETMFKFTNIVMKYAPIGVAAAMAYTIGKGGFGVLYNLAWLVGTFYIALAAFYLLVLVPVMLLFGVPIRKFIKAVKEPAVIAFSTTSSEAALPRAMEAMEHLGVPRSVVAFVLPLGYSFNLDGSTLYLSLAAVFVAQAANVASEYRPTDHAAPDVDAHEQGCGRRSAGVAGDPRRDGGELPAAARRRHADSGRRHVDGHGPHHDERDWQLPRVGGGGAMGRRVHGSQRSRAGAGGGPGRNLSAWDTV